MRDFLEAITPAPFDTRLVFQWGEITVTSPDVHVLIAGETSPIVVDQWNYDYTPATGHRVLLAHVSGTWMILCRIRSA